MLDLNFDEPEGASDLLSPREGSWDEWLAALDRRPAFVGVWSGPEVCAHPGARYRIGGFFVEPLESVVGLRPFDDALEGTLAVEEADEPVPYTIFEVEKIARMMLHQSDLAFEILSTPRWLASEDPNHPCRTAREIVRRAVTSELIAAYRESAADRLDETLDEDELRAATRRLATAVALGDRRVSLHLDRLLDAVATDRDPGELRSTAEALAERLPSAAESLPETPSDYDGLDDWLVETRVAHRLDDRPA